MTPATFRATSGECLVAAGFLAGFALIALAARSAGLIAYLFCGLFIVIACCFIATAFIRQEQQSRRLLQRIKSMKDGKLPREQK